jgi:putative transposase
LEPRLIIITKRADLLGISSSGLYYEPVFDTQERTSCILIGQLYTETPFYGSCKMAAQLQRMRYVMGRKRIPRLMRTIGIEAIYPKPGLSTPHPEHTIYPYPSRNAIIMNRVVI